MSGIDLEDKMQELFESLLRWRDQKSPPDKELVKSLEIMYELLGIFVGTCRPLRTRKKSSTATK